MSTAWITRSAIATGSSCVPRRHPDSHGRWHTRHRTPAIARSRRAVPAASPRFAVPHVPQHRRNAQVRRTDPLARRQAVAEVIAEQQLQGHPAGRPHVVRVVLDLHAVHHPRPAGRNELSVVRHPHRAHHARGPRLVSLQETQRRNLDPRPPRRLKDGRSRGNRQPPMSWSFGHGLGSESGKKRGPPRMPRRSAMTCPASHDRRLRHPNPLTRARPHSRVRFGCILAIPLLTRTAPPGRPPGRCCSSCTGRCRSRAAGRVSSGWHRPGSAGRTGCSRCRHR